MEEFTIEQMSVEYLVGVIRDEEIFLERRGTDINGSSVLHYVTQVETTPGIHCRKNIHT